MPEEVVFLIFSSIAAVTFITFGVMRTVNKHLDRKHGVGGENSALKAELDDLRAQVQGVDDLRERVADLEERTDFNERVLAQQRDRDKLPRGSQ